MILMILTTPSVKNDTEEMKEALAHAESASVSNHTAVRTDVGLWPREIDPCMLDYWLE